jgi:hypothetical protein
METDASMQLWPRVNGDAEKAGLIRKKGEIFCRLHYGRKRAGSCRASTVIGHQKLNRFLIWEPNRTLEIS